MPRIAVLPGDGIGVEITREAVRVLETAARRFGIEFELHEALFGGAAYDKAGTAFPQETVELVEASDAVAPSGAIGAPSGITCLQGSGLRSQASCGSGRWRAYANLRPVAAYPSLASVTLKPEVVRGIDILVVRELTGGVYFGKPRSREPHPTRLRSTRLVPQARSRESWI